ncbi:MAG: hypothetical protein ACOY4O_16805 [Pseudomonadota bacterium]
MKLVAGLLALSLLAVPAFAQHKHGAKGPNGGPMEDVAGVHAELVTSGTSITFNVFDEDNKPIKTAGYSGSALVVTGAERETVQLAASGEALKGEAKKALAKGSSVTLLIKTDKNKTGQAKFSQ